jgi:hypothetical protein
MMEVNQVSTELSFPLAEGSDAGRPSFITSDERPSRIQGWPARNACGL